MMCLATDRSDQFEEHLPGEEDYRVLSTASDRCSGRVGGRPGRQVRQRYVTRWPRGEKAIGPDLARIDTHGFALLATDLARAIAQYAEEPKTRAELGTDTALIRLADLAQAQVASYHLMVTTESGEDADAEADAVEDSLRSAKRAESALSALRSRVGFMTLGALIVAGGCGRPAYARGDPVLSVLALVIIGFGVALVFAAVPRRRRRTRKARKARKARKSAGSSPGGPAALRPGRPRGL
jgi:hypothetical protein